MCLVLFFKIFRDFLSQTPLQNWWSNNKLCFALLPPQNSTMENRTCGDWLGIVRHQFQKYSQSKSKLWFLKVSSLKSLYYRIKEKKQTILVHKSVGNKKNPQRIRHQVSFERNGLKLICPRVDFVNSQVSYLTLKKKIGSIHSCVSWCHFPNCGMLCSWDFVMNWFWCRFVAEITHGQVGKYMIW